MNTKSIIFGNNAREKLLKGMGTIARAVSSTLGPRSRNVSIDYNPHRDRPPVILHDGVSVARSIDLEDPFEDQGARLIKDAALRSNEVAGDGTTTATILAYSIVKEAHKNIQAGSNAMQLRAEIESALKLVVSELKRMSKDIKLPKEVEQVASISAGDKGLGKMVAEVINKVGKDGVITIEEGNGLETEVEYKQGLEVDRGYLSSYFVNKQDTVESVIEEPYILLTDKKLNYASDIVPFLQKFFKAGHKNLVIFAGEVIEEALATLVVNKLRGGANLVAIQSPAYGERRIDELQDLATLTGGIPVLIQEGRSIDTLEIEELGRAEKVIVNRDKTIIIGGMGNKEAIKKRINDLKEQIKFANTDYDKQIKGKRMAQLSGSIAVINVGGAGEPEIKEKKERVIDAVNATKAALEEGVVAGGAVTLLDIAKKPFLNDLGTVGAKILREALLSPFRKLMENSGFDYSEIRERMSGKKYPFGVDVMDGEIKDLIKSGVIDPVKVIRSSLENATSIACLVITTETLVAFKPQKV